MGATVTTGKLVMGFRTNNKVIYLLAEETYEKNCSPHTPRWGCFAIGDYKQVMERVFAHASAAEGGSLQNRANDLTPESYIRGWNLAFHKPTVFPDTAISFRILERNYWRDGIESNMAGLLFTHLKSIDRLDVWQTLVNEEDDKVIVSLYDDIELILSIFGTNGFVSPWRIIDMYYKPYGIEDISLIPQKKNGGNFPPAPLPFVKATGKYSTQYASVKEDGTLSDFVWAYRVVADYVEKDAYHWEMVERGQGIKHIQAFRKTIDALPDGTSNIEASVNKATLTDDASVKAFESYLNVSFTDTPVIYTLPCASYALDHLSIHIKVDFKLKEKSNTIDNLMAA